ncbi:MAG: (2Fe-2S)-binding protein [Pseudomonadota bacterium]
MYVCLCNAINDKTMTAAISEETRHVKDVFRACGHKPQCGKCLSAVANMIAETKADAGTMKLAAE